MSDVIFHHVARAVIVDQGHILLVRSKDHAISFIPGGHIEPAELAEEALRRELHEELGITDAQIGRFLGTWEMVLELANGVHHEIAHLFEVYTGLSAQVQPAAAEADLEFFWTELSETNLRELDVKPFLVPQVIPKMVQGDKPLWASGNRGEVRIKEEAREGLS